MSVIADAHQMAGLGSEYRSSRSDTAWRSPACELHRCDPKLHRLFPSESLTVGRKAASKDPRIHQSRGIANSPETIASIPQYWDRVQGDTRGSSPDSEHR